MNKFLMVGAAAITMLAGGAMAPTESSTSQTITVLSAEQLKRVSPSMLQSKFKTAFL